MRGGRWLAAVATGAAVGAGVASWTTWADWRLNPAGLFHGPAGTDWAVVGETWVSWFLPVAAAACALAGGVVAWRSRG